MSVVDEDFIRTVNFEHYRTSIELVRELGVLAIKTLITLNSGAFIVLLTFIGNTAAQSQFIVELHILKASLFCFLAGLALSGVAILVIYVHTQAASPWPDNENIPTDRMHLARMTGPPLLSFLAFLIGVLLLIVNIKSA